MSGLSILSEALARFGSPKQLAKAGGFSQWTAARYQRGETVPDILTITRLMSVSKEIADAVLSIAGLGPLEAKEIGFIRRATDRVARTPEAPAEEAGVAEEAAAARVLKP